MKDITSILEDTSCKLILTFRIQVFQDKAFKHSSLQLFQTCICNLKDKKLALTNLEKDKFVTKYFRSPLKDKIKCLYKYDFFPLLCKLYIRNTVDSNFCLETFLKGPFDFYKKELDDLFVDCKEGKYKFSALLVLVVFNNRLRTTVLLGKDDKVKTVLEAVLEECGINERLTSKSLISELDTLIGTFLSNEDGLYHTIHDKLFDFLAYYFGTNNEVTQTDFTELLIRHAEEKLIEERFVVKEPGQSDDKKSKEYLITIQDDNLQLYIERVFDDMTKADNKKIFLLSNRNERSKTFQKTLCSFIKNLKKEKVLNIIQTASSVCVREMFIMDGNDIGLYSPFLYGIILDHDHLQKYIERMFFDMTTSDDVEFHMHQCRCCSNEAFRTALLTYISKLSSTEITNLIQIASTSFVQLMFVMKKDEIHFDSLSVFERYGIEINRELKHLYSQRVFKEMIQSTDVPNYISSWRCCRNKDFNTAMQSFMVKLSFDIVIEHIKNASNSFVQNMFVFEENDIKLKCRHVYTNYGIVLSADVVQLYINRVFNDITMSDDVNEHLNGNRNKGNRVFQCKLLHYMTHLDGQKIQHLIEHASQNFIYKLCVMSMDEIHKISNSEWERYGVIIPDECIQLYVCRWFDDMTKCQSVHRYFEGNRNRQTKKFKTALLTYMAEISEERIEKLIQTGSGDFLHNLFVTTKKDIKNDSNIDIEQYGIVLPDKYLNMYTKRILDLDYFKENIACKRTINAVLTCISQYDISRITEIIHASNENVFHQMITVDIENEFSYPDYLCPDPIVKNMFEIEGRLIIFPVILINLYMDRMISDWSNGESHAVFKNKNLKNQSFVDRFLDYLNLLEPSKISELLHIKGNRRDYTPLDISCEQGEVNLAKWCLEKHLHENPEQEHNRLFALFLLVVFNNELEETFLNDELIKITDSKFSFRNMHHIREDISVRVVKEELNTSLQIIGVGKIDGIYSVRHSKVFQFLVFYFASIRHMSKVLVEYADEKLLTNGF
ncbi:unnamed protein product [Mytilus coruscus]|uniref:Uncharacterized protein n=1 Tax=Mytilus coruscus TaxID=42192 RepID=A0A6J8CV27_MYTCO|nr:unnamed protein product [Mytilus coruscus]